MKVVLWGGSLVLVTLTFACDVAAKNRPKAGEQGERKAMTAHIEIIPGVSIGGVKVGAQAADLPRGARIRKDGDELTEGQLDQIHFVFDEGRIADVWIDLKQAFGEIRLLGRTLREGSSLEDVKRILGPCERIAGKGAIEYRCFENLRLATDFKDMGTVLRLHLTWPPPLF